MSTQSMLSVLRTSIEFHGCLKIVFVSCCLSTVFFFFFLNFLTRNSHVKKNRIFLVTEPFLMAYHFHLNFCKFFVCFLRFFFICLPYTLYCG